MDIIQEQMQQVYELRKLAFHMAEERQLSRPELAKKANISLSAINLIFDDDELDMYDLPKIIRLLNFLGVEVEFAPFDVKETENTHGGTN